MKIYLHRIISVFNSPPPTGWPCLKTSTTRFDVTLWNISQYYCFKLSRLYYPTNTKISNGFLQLKPLDCPATSMSLTWSKTFKNWWTASGIELLNTHRNGLKKFRTTICYAKTCGSFPNALKPNIKYNFVIILTCLVLQIFIKMVENTSRCLFFPKLIGSSIFLILVCSIIPVAIGSPTNNTKVRFITFINLASLSLGCVQLFFFNLFF